MTVNFSPIADRFLNLRVRGLKAGWLLSYPVYSNDIAVISMTKWIFPIVNLPLTIYSNSHLLCHISTLAETSGMRGRGPFSSVGECLASNQLVMGLIPIGSRDALMFMLDNRIILHLMIVVVPMSTLYKAFAHANVMFNSLINPEDSWIRPSLKHIFYHPDLKLRLSVCFVN